MIYQKNKKCEQHCLARDSPAATKSFSKLQKLQEKYYLFVCEQPFEE